MPQHHIHEGAFEMPEGWRDQSMTVFRLPAADGSKEAAILVTRDYDTPLEDVGEYADTQQEAAKKSFAGFKPLGREDITIDGEPAVLVDYQWRANGNVMLRQRQAYVRHQNVTLTLTATAAANEFARIEAVWAKVLSSFKLLVRDDEIGTEGAGAAVVLPHVLALSTQDHVLTVYADRATACARTDPFEVEDERWVFFASSGQPLKAVFVVKNRRGVMKKTPGQFELVDDEVGVSRPLHERLRGIAAVRGLAPLQTLDDIQAHLSGANPVAVADRAE